MHFEGEFRVPGRSDDVMRRFADVPRMARCMPGAVLEPQAEDGSWPGAMVVAFGPKKINFKGRVTCDFDTAAKTGALHGRGTADMRAARIGVKVNFALHDDPGATAPTTIVTIKSDAELGGVLADFARTGGIAVANVVMQDFARRATEEFAKDAPVAAPVTPTPAEVAASREAPSHGAATTAPPPAAASMPSPSAGATPNRSPPDAASATPAPATEQRVSAQSAETPAPSAMPPPAPATALSAHGILWAVIKLKLHQLAQWLGLAARDAS